jgi:hypothetical protein
LIRTVQEHLHGNHHEKQIGAHRAEIQAALADAVELLSDGDLRRGGAALSRARGLAAEAGTDDWARELAVGFELCTEFVASRFGL